MAYDRIRFEFDEKSGKYADALGGRGSDHLFNLSRIIITYRMRRGNAGMSTRGRHRNSDIEITLFSDTRERDHSSELVILDPG